MRSVISVYVENKYGVLTRVAGLFLRRGFNIDSLTVGETEDPKFSRMTITMKSDEATRIQLVHQLAKLHNVKSVEVIERASRVERELLIVKVKNSPETRTEIMAATEIYRAKIIDYHTDAMCIEVTGDPSKINAFIELVRPMGIIELCRTGAVALKRSSVTE